MTHSEKQTTLNFFSKVRVYRVSSLRAISSLYILATPRCVAELQLLTLLTPERLKMQYLKKTLMEILLPVSSGYTYD